MDATVFEQLRRELKRVLLLRSCGKLASTPPTDSASAAHLTLDGATDELYWAYTIKGDYDQNGEVNISDLTPLGLHFGESGDFDYDGIQSVIDGDGNGEINISDVTAIGMSFGLHVSAYHVYASASFADVPASPELPNGSGTQLLGLAEMSEGEGPGRLQFGYQLASNPPGTYYWVRPTDGAADGVASNFTAPAGDSLGAAGGAVQVGEALIQADAETLLGDVQLSCSPAAVPPGAPQDFQPAGLAFDIGVSDESLLNAPLIITLPYDDSSVDDEGYMLALHYNAVEGYRPLAPLAIDPVNDTITVALRTFSPIVPGALTPQAVAQLPLADATAFTPAANGWPMDNFGNYFAPGGNCYGMSSFAIWFFQHRPETLFGHYSTAGGRPISIAHLTATRAHIAVNLYWNRTAVNLSSLISQSEVATGNLMRWCITQDEPIVLQLQHYNAQQKKIDVAHAAVVYGYDATGFNVYDPNYNNETKHLDWSTAAGFANYTHGAPAGGYQYISFTAQASLGRNSDFAALASEADGGFANSSEMTLNLPAQGASIDSRSTTISGTLAGSLNPLATVLAYVNGRPYTIPASGGAFAGEAWLEPGANTIVLLAGPDAEEHLSAWHKNSATLIREVTSTAAERYDMLVTLTWDYGNVDLYVTEPDGKTTWDEHFNYYGGPWFYSPWPLNLEQVSTGPYAITREGDYTIRIHYHDYDGGNPAPTRAVVNIVLNEGQPSEWRKSYMYILNEADASNSAPGSNGTGWADVAIVRPINL